MKTPPFIVRALIASCALALGACAGLPGDRKALDGNREPPAAARAFDAPRAAWPDDRWWTAYGDAQLDSIIAEALKGSPSIAEAQARLQKAEASQLGAQSALKPSLTANGSASEQKQSHHYLTPPAFTPDGWKDYGRTTLDFSWEIDFWGKNRAALVAATSEVEAARADAAQARLILSTSIASSYAELARLHAARETSRAALQIRMQSAQLFGERQAHGLENRGAVRQADSRRASAELDLKSTDEQIALQRNRIAALMGAGPDRALDIAPPAVNLQRGWGLPANLSADLLGRRPDIVAARLRAEAAASRIDQARAAFYPNVNLSAFIGALSLGLGSLTQAGSQIGSVGPAISLPIFDGGRLRGQLRGAEAEYAIAVAGYDKALVQALQDVADAAASQKAIGGELDSAHEAVEAAREAWRVQKERYDGGLSNYLDVLNAEDNLVTTLRTQTDLAARTFSLDVALVRALGGGYSLPSS